MKVVIKKGWNPDELEVKEINHGDNIIGWNVLFVPEEGLCEKPCEWCHDLVFRIYSRIGNQEKTKKHLRYNWRIKK